MESGRPVHGLIERLQVGEQVCRQRRKVPGPKHKATCLIGQMTHLLGCKTQLSCYNSSMFESLFGNATADKVLLFLARFGEGYPRQIAGNFAISLNMVQQQLEKLESAGILVSQLKGRTRIYQWNPRYPFRKELLALLNKAFDFMSKKEKDRFYTKRTRPRRKGKPL